MFFIVTSYVTWRIGNLKVILVCPFSSFSFCLLSLLHYSYLQRISFHGLTFLKEFECKTLGVVSQLEEEDGSCTWLWWKKLSPIYTTSINSTITISTWDKIVSCVFSSGWLMSSRITTYLRVESTPRFGSII